MQQVKVTKVTVTIPRPQTTQLTSNVLGLAGLAAIAIAVGGITGNWWWTLLLAGVFAFGLAWVANTHAQTTPQADGEAAEAALRLRPVPVPRNGVPAAAVTG